MRLLYWAKEALIVIAAALGAVAIYTLLMSTSDLSTTEELGSTACGYLAGIGAFMLLIYTVAGYKSFLPLALSMGASRKECIVGLHIFRLSSALVLTAAGAAICAVTGGFQLGGFVSVQGASLLLFAAVGMLVGGLCQRFNTQTVAVLSVVASIVGMALCGGLAALLVLGLDMLNWILWLLPGAAVLIYMGCSFWEARTVRRFCVR